MKATALVLVFAAARVALADGAPNEDVCFDAAVAGQKARKSGVLPKARADFLRCAQAACPAVVTARCTGWVAEVDAAMPSIVVAPQDDRGRDATLGTVIVDGTSHPESFAGQPITLTPGAHTVRFEVQGRAPVEQAIVVREYEKNRRVPMRLLPLAAKTPIAPFVLGGIGVLSGLAFGGFAIAGAVDRSSSHCDTGCASTAYSRVSAELVTADVTLGVAVVFLTIAVVDYFVVRGARAKPVAGSLPFVVTF